MVLSRIRAHNLLKLEGVDVGGAGQVTLLAPNKRKNLIQSGLGRR